MARNRSRRRTEAPERDTVAMVHPSGTFTVLVSPARALKLRERGYTTSKAADAPSTPKRPELVERAKAVGIPAKGTNDELLAAIVAAEQAAVTQASSAAAAAGSGDDDDLEPGEVRQSSSAADDDDDDD